MKASLGAPFDLLRIEGDFDRIVGVEQWSGPHHDLIERRAG
jgi:hypothetical protein